MDELFNARLLARMIAEELAPLLAGQHDDILDVRGAAKLLKRSPDTVQALAASGELPARKVGRAWAFRRSALLEYVTPHK